MKSFFNYFCVNHGSQATYSLGAAGLATNATVNEQVFSYWLNKGAPDRQLVTLVGCKSKASSVCTSPAPSGCVEGRESEARANKTLAAMDVVGFTEHLTDFWRAVTTFLGLPCTNRSVTARNVAAHPDVLPVSRMSPATLDLLQNRSAHMLALYARFSVTSQTGRVHLRSPVATRTRCDDESS